MNYVTINLSKLSIDDVIETLNVFLGIPLGYPNESETLVIQFLNTPGRVAHLPLFSRNFHRTQLTNFFC